MTVTPRSRLSAKDALRHTWMDDAVAVAKAQRLMGIQQTRYISYKVFLEFPLYTQWCKFLSQEVRESRA